ncbi:MAG: SIMPL domain-containing protein [Thermoleophilaceae bacterium]
MAGRTRNRPLRASAAAIAVLAIAAPGAFAQARTVSVVGDATATATNDTASFNLRVTTRAKQAAVALNRNSARMRRVVAAVKAQGIPAADIETQQVSLSRVRVKTRKGQHRHVYRASNSIGVTVRQVGKTGTVIGAGVNAGATGVGGVELSSSQSRQLYRQALGDAFDDAKAKAQELADRAGATLGDAQTITEGFQEVDSGNEQSAVGFPASGPPIEPGTTKIFAEVSVTFALE